VPASGFQSVQFRMLEIKLGLKKKNRLPIDAEFFTSRLNEKDRAIILEHEEKVSILELLDAWLARMPFSKFKTYDFWSEYKNAVDEMLKSDQTIIESNQSMSEAERKRELMNLNITKESFSMILDS